MDKDQSFTKVYQIIDQNYTCKILFNTSKQNNQFYDGNGRTCKILFANDDKLIKLTERTKNLKNL